MENPIYDMVIMGASGFTGKYVVREALKFVNAPNSPLKTLAIAGRNPTKLNRVLEWASYPNPPPPDISVLTADVADPASLHRVASQTRLVLNCVGPFRLYSQPVVAACVAAACDYLDICGEPEFMESMEAQYHDAAAEKGALVVSACGFDSVPAEMGLIFNSRQWVPPSLPNRVEAYLSLESDSWVAGNFGTYESLVLGVANGDKLKQLRSSRPRRARPEIPGPPPPKEPLISHHKKIGLWGVRLPAADSTVVRRTLSTLKQNPRGLRGVNETDAYANKRTAFWSTVKPAHFVEKLASKSVLGVFRSILAGLFVGYLSRNSIGRWLLLTFPLVFSLGMFTKNGPTEDELARAVFKMWFVGTGYSDGNLARKGNAKPDMEIITRIMGPEGGYRTAPIAIVQCALVVLSQRGDLPKGGVFTPGIVFSPTDLQQRLQENGISFDVVSKSITKNH